MTERISYREAYDNRSVPVQIAGKQDKLTPANGIYINDDNEIGLYGVEFGGYEAGEGISIEENVISNTVSIEGLATEEYVDEQIEDAVQDKQDTLVAGQNITIENNVISSTCESEVYTAGSGISISNNVISNTAQPDVNKAYVDSGLEGKQDYSILLRKIHIGTAQTPSSSLGEDGDLYIYRPTE